MKIYLVKRSFFTFREKESYETDLCGKTVLSLMAENLGAEVCGEDTLPAGEKVVLYPCYPFLSLRRLNGLLRSREGSFSFRGGYVDRGGERKKTGARFPFPLFTLADLPAVLARAGRAVAAYHAKRGALVEEGAETDYASELKKGCIVRKGARVIASVIGENAEICGDSVIENSVIGAETVIKSSRVLHSVVKKGCTVGPFSMLRAGSSVGDGCRIGDFVEIKNSSLGEGCKAAHLAYIGDATLGKKVNVGCGVVFANYNGKIKQRSSVGDGCFLGSNCNLIAPVTLGDGVFLAAGTTLTRDLSSSDFCIGRCRERVKEGGAEKYLGKRE